MKFKEGDRVLVVKAQEGIPAMQALIGQICTIEEANELGQHYILAGDPARYVWWDELLDWPQDNQEEIISEFTNLLED